MFRKIVQPFYTIYVVATFLISILAAFPFFVIISLGNNAAARKAIYTIIKVWAGGWLWLIGMPLKKINPLPQTGRYIVIANHTSYLDTILIFPAAPGYFRPLGKKESSKIPIVGFIYRQVTIMVDRGSVHSRARSMRLLWKVLHKEGSILIFPEGTFNETGKPLKEFYDGAFRLAINSQASILPIVFPDAVHRWHYSAWWKFWPGKNRVVYLEPVTVSGMTMADLPMLKQRIHERMEEELIKYKT